MFRLFVRGRSVGGSGACAGVARGAVTLVALSRVLGVEVEVVRMAAEMI